MSKKDGWLPVESVKPPCKRDANALGTPVLIWPRNPNYSVGIGIDGFCYYGRRATCKPAFYLFGTEIRGVTHWQAMPKGPTK